MGSFYDKIATWLCSVPSDKYVHLLVCQLIAWIVANIFSLISPWYLALLLGMAVALFVGLMKEKIDGKQIDDNFDMSDLVADLTGAVLGSLMAVI